MARRVRLAPRVTGGEQPDARHDHDDGQRAVGGQVRAQALVEQPRQVLRRDVIGHVHKERPGSRVDDLVGGERSAQHEGPSGGRGGERGSEGCLVERDDPERVAAREQPAERWRDHVDQRTRASRVDAGRSRIFGAVAAGRRRGATLRAPDLPEEPRGSLVDLLRRVSTDDEPVVLQQGHRRRGPARAGPVDAASIDDGTREGEARIGVGNPQCLVAEQAPDERGAVAVAGDRVDLDRVCVQDEALGQEGVEQQLHGGPAPAGVTQPRRHPGAHDRVPGESVRVRRRVARPEHLEERLHVQRDEIVRGERREGDAARLDVQDAVDLRRGVAAPTSRELGVPTIAPGDLDQSVERRDRRRRQLPASGREGAHRAATLDASSISSRPISANQWTREVAVGEARVEPALTVHVAWLSGRPEVLVGGHHAGGFPERRPRAGGRQRSVDAVRLQRDPSPGVVLRPGHHDDPGLAEGRHVGVHDLWPVAPGDQLRDENPAGLEALGQLGRRLLPRADGERSVRQRRVARNAAQPEDHPDGVAERDGRLRHEGWPAGLHQRGTYPVLDADRVVHRADERLPDYPGQQGAPSLGRRLPGRPPPGRPSPRGAPGARPSRAGRRIAPRPPPRCSPGSARSPARLPRSGLGPTPPWRASGSHPRSGPGP